jgi:hypothetical protein
MKIRAVLLASLLGNALLLAVLARGRLRETPPAATPAPAPAAETAPPSAHFRWSQLEAPDYPTYIANLRSVGCPERTIADIIAADVEANFAQKWAQLEHQNGVSQASGPTTSPADRQSLEALRANLFQEETNLVSSLLGAQPQSPPADSASSAGQSAAFYADASSQPPRTAKPTIPLAFAGGNPGSENLTPTEQAAIDSQQQYIRDQLGGPGADPSTPEYKQKYQQVQLDADQHFKVLYGYQVWQQRQLQAYGQQQASSQQAQ